MLQRMRGERGHSGDGSGNGELTRQSGSVGGVAAGSLLILKLRCGGLSRDVKQEQLGEKSFSSQPPGYRVIWHKCHWLHFYLSSIRVILVPFGFSYHPSPCLYCLLSLYSEKFLCICFCIASNLLFSALSFLSFGSFHLDEELCCRLQKIFKHH